MSLEVGVATSANLGAGRSVAGGIVRIFVFGISIGAGRGALAFGRESNLYCR